MDSQILRGPDIRNRNEKLVLYSIYASDGISQSEVSKLTGLKPPTVLRIFSNLVEQGLIEISPKQKGSPERKGRKPVFYRTKADACYAIGIDFWMNSAVIVIVDFHGTPVYHNEIRLEAGLDAEGFAARLAVLIRKTAGHYGIPPAKLLGVGIGGPGRVDVTQGKVIYYAGIAGMVNFDLKAKLEKAVEVPVFIHNNVAVIAASEYRYGKGRSCDALITVSIRAGIGGAMVSGGKIFLNQNRTSLELGHMSIDMHGRACSCGSRGCLDAYITEGMILEDLKAYRNIEHFEEIDDLIEEADSRVMNVLREKAEILALGLRNLFKLFGPQLFIIVTRSAALSALFAEAAQRAIDADPTIHEGNRVEVLSDVYNPVMTGHGAADLVMDSFFSA